MPDLQEAQAILSKCTKKLSTYQKEAREISVNKDVIAWQKVNIDSFTDIIEALGLPDDLRQSRDNYPGIASNVLREIRTLQNNIANLEADINLGSPIPVVEAMTQARKIQQQTNNLSPAMEQLRKCKVGLESSSIALKKNLNLQTLLPLARASATGKKKSVFETGFEIYLITTRDEGFEEEGQINMYTYFTKATLLQKKIAKPMADNLPPLAYSMVSQQLRLCHEALQEVKDFVLFVENYVKKDIKNISIFHSQLAEVTNKPLTDILFNIPAETEKVGACIRDFTHKKFLLEELDRAAQLLLMVEQFFQIFKDYFIDYLHEQSHQKNGLLNPETLAKARASSYFKGITGIFRMIRIFLGSFNKQDAITEEILAEKLHSILQNCTIFFGHGEDDQQEVTTFLETYFANYTSPFPHDELLDVSRKCLSTFGMLLQKVMFRYKADHNNVNTYSLGRLSGKIEVRMSNLQKYRKKLTPS